MLKKITFLLAAALLLMVNVCFATGNGEKQKLHEELTQMIGDTGTKVPGMGVIVYKDGKEVFSDFLGSAIVDSKNPQTKPFPGGIRIQDVYGLYAYAAAGAGQTGLRCGRKSVSGLPPQKSQLSGEADYGENAGFPYFIPA